MRRRGFTLIELLVVIGIIGLLLAIILPAAERVRHRAYLQLCASNLRTIGQMTLTYASANRGQFPRTVYVPGAPIAEGTAAASDDPFGPTGPAANDVTAAFFLLSREMRLSTITFVCPYDDVFEYVADPADPTKRSNFTDLGKNLGYSFADPYPDAAAVKNGYVWNAKLGEAFVLAADKNPGKDIFGSDVTADLTHRAGRGCSRNHERDGQNVLYADGHVIWQMTPLCGLSSGTGNDNIYTNQSNVFDASPLNGADTLLLPTDDPQ